MLVVKYKLCKILPSALIQLFLEHLLSHLACFCCHQVHWQKFPKAIWGWDGTDGTNNTKHTVDTKSIDEVRHVFRSSWRIFVMRSGNVPTCELHLVVAVSTSNWNLILFQAFNCVFKSTFEYHWYYLGRGAKRAIKLPQITDNYMSRHVWVYIFVGICVTRGPLLTKATPFFLSYVGKFNTKHNTVMEEKMGEKNTVIIHRKNPMMDCSSELGKNGKKKQKKEEFSNRLLNCHAWDLGGVKWGSNSKWRGHTFRTNSRQGLLIELQMMIIIQHQCIHPISCSTM